MDTSTLITAGIGIVTTFTSGWVSYLFTKRKYNSEVDNQIITNMKESLDFYQKLSDDNKNRLDTLIERNDYLSKEVEELKACVNKLSVNICTVVNCTNRTIK